MIRNLIILLLFLIAQVGCDNPPTKTLTPEMKINARNSVIEYLNKNNLPIENLAEFKSKVKNQPDFAFLYTGGGRCIEFVVECYNSLCNKVSNYPYDEHDEECP